jgi:stage II sporulation protein D
MIVTTNGYGHGAGMCQNGANYYAQRGYNYQQILQHYYLGAVVQKNNKYI